MKSSRINSGVYQQLPLPDKSINSQFSSYNEFPDEHLWSYEDPQGNMQGDFSDSQMMEWLLAGRYFTPKLRLKRKCDSELSTLSNYNILFQRIPFTRGYRVLPLSSEITDSVIKLVQKGLGKSAQNNDTIVNDTSEVKRNIDNKFLGFSNEDLAGLNMHSKDSILSGHAFTNHNKEKNKSYSSLETNTPVLHNSKSHMDSRINGNTEHQVNAQINMLCKYLKVLSNGENSSRPSSFMAPGSELSASNSSDENQSIDSAVVQQLLNLLPSLQLSNGTNSNDTAQLVSQLASVMSNMNESASHTQKSCDNLSQSWPFESFYNSHTSDSSMNFNSNNNNKQTNSLWSSSASLAPGAVSRSISDTTSSKYNKSHLKNESISNEPRGDTAFNSFVQPSQISPAIQNNLQSHSIRFNGLSCNNSVSVNNPSETNSNLHESIHSNKLDSSPLNWPVWSTVDSFSSHQRPIGFNNTAYNSNQSHNFMLDSDTSGSPDNLLNVSSEMGYQISRNNFYPAQDDQRLEHNQITMLQQSSVPKKSQQNEKPSWPVDSGWSRPTAKQHAWAPKLRSNDVIINPPSKMSQNELSSPGKSNRVNDKDLSSKSNEQCGKIATTDKLINISNGKKERHNKQSHSLSGNTSQQSGSVDPDLAKLIRWTQDILHGVELREPVDIPTIVELLASIDAPYEIETMFKSYLGDSPRIQQFIKDFLDRRRPYWHKQRQEAQSSKQKSKVNGSQSPIPKAQNSSVSHASPCGNNSNSQTNKQSSNLKKTASNTQLLNHLSASLDSVDNLKKGHEGQWRQSKPKNGRKNKKASTKNRA